MSPANPPTDPAGNPATGGPARRRKICMLGDFAVGKTSLVRRLVEGRFDADYRSTLGAAMHPVILSGDGRDGDGDDMCVMVWDIEGRDEHRADWQTYIQGSVAAIIVADRACQQSLNSLDAIATAYLTRQPGRAIAFALNKSDLVSEETADEAMIIKALDHKFAAPILRTSALSGEGVAALFRRAVTEALSHGL